MTKHLLFFLPLLVALNSFSQKVIEGDEMLNLIGKPITDPVYQKWRKQEDLNSGVYKPHRSVDCTEFENKVSTIGLSNGLQRVSFDGKKLNLDGRYGYYKKKLPLGLNWKMNKEAFQRLLGKPEIGDIPNLDLNEYSFKGWQIDVIFENNIPRSIRFEKARTSTITEINPVERPSAPAATPLIKFDAVNATAQVNWPVLKQFILGYKDMKPFTGKDSTAYTNAIFYSTPYKIEGFDKTAIKRNKEKGDWYYETYFFTAADSDKVHEMFVALYHGLDQALKDNTGDDFLGVVTANGAFSKSPLTWLVTWKVRYGYKNLPPGLERLKIGLIIIGSKIYNKDALEYTMKIYIADEDVRYDQFGWGKPD